MPKFAANLTFLFKELPFLERFEAAAHAGFEGVEVLFPYDDPASEILMRLNGTGLPMVLFNAPPPNWTGGARGFAAVPGGEERFRSDFRRALRFAGRLGPLHIHIMAGEANGTSARETFIRNLKWAADFAPRQSLTIEPLNQTDMPGYFLSDYGLAAEIIEEVGRPNLALQYDAYHAQMIHGDAMGMWEKHGAISHHIQVGSVPGRHEPMGSAVDFPALFAAIDESGYAGFVSGEYNPSGRTEESLGWMQGEFS